MILRRKKFRFIGDNYLDNIDNENTKKDHLKVTILFFSIVFMPLILVSILRIIIRGWY